MIKNKKYLVILSNTFLFFLYTIFILVETNLKQQNKKVNENLSFQPFNENINQNNDNNNAKKQQKQQSLWYKEMYKQMHQPSVLATSESDEKFYGKK